MCYYQWKYHDGLLISPWRGTKVSRWEAGAPLRPSGNTFALIGCLPVFIEQDDVVTQQLGASEQE